MDDRQTSAGQKRSSLHRPDDSQAVREYSIPKRYRSGIAEHPSLLHQGPFSGLQHRLALNGLNHGYSVRSRNFVPNLHDPSNALGSSVPDFHDPSHALRSSVPDFHDPSYALGSSVPDFNDPSSALGSSVPLPVTEERDVRIEMDSDVYGDDYIEIEVLRGSPSDVTLDEMDGEDTENRGDHGHEEHLHMSNIGLEGYEDSGSIQTEPDVTRDLDRPVPFYSESFTDWNVPQSQNTISVSSAGVFRFPYSNDNSNDHGQAIFAYPTQVTSALGPPYQGLYAIPEVERTAGSSTPTLNELPIDPTLPRQIIHDYSNHISLSSSVDEGPDPITFDSNLDCLPQPTDNSNHPFGSSSINENFEATLAFEDGIVSSLDSNIAYEESYPTNQGPDCFVTSRDISHEDHFNDCHNDGRLADAADKHETAIGKDDAHGEGTIFAGQKRKELCPPDGFEDETKVPDAKRLKTADMNIEHRSPIYHRHHRRRPKAHHGPSRSWNFVPVLDLDAFSSVPASAGWPWAHPAHDYDHAMDYNPSMVHPSYHQQHRAASGVVEGRREEDVAGSELFHDSVDPLYTSQIYTNDANEDEMQEVIAYPGPLSAGPIDSSSRYSHSAAVEEVGYEKSYCDNSPHILRPISPVTCNPAGPSIPPSLDTLFVGQKSKEFHPSDGFEDEMKLPAAKRTKTAAIERLFPVHRRHYTRRPKKSVNHRDSSQFSNSVPEFISDDSGLVQPSPGWPWAHSVESNLSMDYDPSNEGASGVIDGHATETNAPIHGLFYDSVDPLYMPRIYGGDKDEDEEMWEEEIESSGGLPAKHSGSSTRYPYSVTIEEVEDEEINRHKTKNTLGPHGHILRPRTPVYSSSEPSNPPPPPLHEHRPHRSQDPPPPPSGYSEIPSTWNWNDDQPMDPRTSGDSSYVEVNLDEAATTDQSTKLNPPRGQSSRSLSPLTEIPPTPGPSSSSANLRDELLSLVENGKNHFLSQMDGADKAKLQSLMDRCYQYLGVLNRFEHSESTSNNAQDEPVISVLSRTSGPKLYKAPKRKSEGRNDLAAQVRYETGVLLGTVDENGDTRDLVTPSAKEISIFLRDGTGGPTLENFRLQLQGKGKATKWNKAAAVVFSQHFLSKEAYQHYSQKKDKELIRKAFLTHITQLQRDFKRQGRPLTIEERDEERLMRRMNRRTGELQRLVNTFKRLYIDYKGPLGELAKYLELITADCLSGDESGPESGDQIYYKTTVPWRSQELAEFLDLLRAYHMSTRHIRQGRYDRGKLPHIRLPSHRPDTVIDSTRAPKKLPINWYNPSFLHAQDQEQLAVLAPKPAVSLQLPDGVKRTAKRFIAVKKRGDIPLPVDHPSLS
ncbi:hypothetical protein FB446DRAFT_792568 [Lentinula raphanica]|nr:hypothetical protein FB446DRAFT_792568 [Lentinula raphanica]